MPVRSLTHHGLTWYYAPQATEADLHRLQRKFHFHKLDIEDCLSEHERPKIEDYGTYLFCVFYVPCAGKQSRVVKEEVNVFLGKDYIVTLSEGNGDFFDQLWKSIKLSKRRRDDYMQQGSGFFLYKLMHDLFDLGFPLVDAIRIDLRRIEGELFEDEENAVFLHDILTLQRNIIKLRSILSPQRSLMPIIQHKNRALIGEDLALYFDDIQDAIERQWSLLDTAKEMSEALQDTHESWLTHKTNTIIRILTVFSVVLLPLNLIAGLYGMNVALPGQDHPGIFFILMGVMWLVLVGFFGYFAWKKWL